MGEFGDKFRKARESKNLTFDAVANVTKISSRMLQAIENERFDQLPGGVFNKGFIRAYAKHLGLSDEEAISDYLACLRQAQIDAQEVLDPARQANLQAKSAPAKTARKGDAGKTAPRAAEPEKRPLPYDKPSLQPLPPVQVEEAQAGEEELPGLQLPRAEDVRPPRRDYVEKRSGGAFWSLAALVVLIVALAAFLWIRHTRVPHAKVENAPAPAATNNAPQQPAPAAPSTPPTSAPQTPAAAVPQPATPQPTTAPENAAARKPPATTETNKDSNVVERSDVTIRTFGNPGAPPAAKATATITLIIRATETCWISVIADGQLVTQETLIAPAATSVHANNQIVARIGNAAGVTFLLNGKEIPAQGAEAEVRTFSFDSTGIHELPN